MLDLFDSGRHQFHIFLCRKWTQRDQLVPHVIWIDDVRNFLSISPFNSFYSRPKYMTRRTTMLVARELLGVTMEEASLEMNLNKCCQYNLQQLCDMYKSFIQIGQYMCIVSTYLLHLVGSTIFAHKTHTWIQGTMLVCSLIWGATRIMHEVQLHWLCCMIT